MNVNGYQNYSIKYFTIKKPNLMKRKILFSILVLLMVVPAITQAQSPASPVVYTNWTPLPENSINVEVEYRVIKCDAVAQVHLFLFNENNVDKLVQLIVEITNNDDQQKITKEVSFQTTKFTMYKALCESDASLNALKLDLPAAYNPANISIKVTIKP